MYSYSGKCQRNQASTLKDFYRCGILAFLRNHTGVDRVRVVYTMCLQLLGSMLDLDREFTDDTTSSVHVHSSLFANDHPFPNTAYYIHISICLIEEISRRRYY